jgi:hypothetical protein
VSRVGDATDCNGGFANRFITSRNGKPMKVETATKLTALAFRVTGDLNEMLREIQESESADEFHRLRGAIGSVLGSIFSEILQPTFTEHPELVPDDFRNP